MKYWTCTYAIGLHANNCHCKQELDRGEKDQVVCVCHSHWLCNLGWVLGAPHCHMQLSLFLPVISVCKAPHSPSAMLSTHLFRCLPGLLFLYCSLKDGLGRANWILSHGHAVSFSFFFFFFWQWSEGLHINYLLSDGLPDFLLHGPCRRYWVQTTVASVLPLQSAQLLPVLWVLTLFTELSTK